MPELPEVEVVRRALEPFLVGRVPLSFRVSGKKMREDVPAAVLADALAGRPVAAVRRRAKYLIVEVEGARALVIHLGMSGRLALLDSAAPGDRHDHLAIAFDDGRELRFNDARRFGRVGVHYLSAPGGVPEFLAGLGPEPLERGFDGAVLRAAIGARRTPIKTLLLDQNVVAGVGNIYAVEALFRAGVRPDRPAASLSAPEADALARAIKTVLRASIRQGGTTLRDHRIPDGSEGRFARKLLVYGRAGQPCPNCGRALSFVRQSGRATCFCAGCQS